MEWAHPQYHTGSGWLKYLKPFLKTCIVSCSPEKMSQKEYSFMRGERFEASYVSHEKDVRLYPFIPVALQQFSLALCSGNGKVQLSSNDGPLSVNCEGPGHLT